MPTDAEVAQAASEAAEETIFARLDRSTVADFDVTVDFDGDDLEVDVWIHAPDAEADLERLADDAALAAGGAADECLREEEDQQADGDGRQDD